jgi:hypothetical protein
MLMEVTCRCGWTIRGSKAQVISGIQEHALAEHNTRLSPGEVRAVWRVAEEGPSARQQGGR